MVATGPTIVVIDRSDATSEVLAAALASYGAQVFSARDTAAGLRLAATRQASVIVLDLDVDALAANVSAGTISLTGTFAARLILLGARRGALPAAARLAKPYHYAALVRRIEELLAPSLVSSRAGS